MVDFTSLKKESAEVFISKKKYLALQKSDMNELLQAAESTSRKRMRLCSHRNTNESVHEMFIVHPRGAYVRPHKHIGKSESMFIIDGEVDYVIFDDAGKIKEVIKMGDYQSEKPFYHTMRTEQFHTLLIRSEHLVFLEITKGPFCRTDTIFADWSPLESDKEKVKEFIINIEKNI